MLQLALSLVSPLTALDVSERCQNIYSLKPDDSKLKNDYDKCVRELHNMKKEVDSLKETNIKLTKENTKLVNQIDVYESAVKETLSNVITSDKEEIPNDYGEIMTNDENNDALDSIFKTLPVEEKKPTYIDFDVEPTESLKPARKTTHVSTKAKVQDVTSSDDLDLDADSDDVFR